MTAAVTHHPRLAWDGAMAFVGAADHDDLYGWLAERLGDVLGPPAVRELADTYTRLRYSARPDAPHVERGRWRARLEGALATEPDRAGVLQALIRDTFLRLREVEPFGFAG
jgi:hypothetical protein